MMRSYGLTGALVLAALALAAFAAQAGAKPGQLDRSFGGGIVAVQPPTQPFAGWHAQEVATGPNGRAYVLEETEPCRYSSDPECSSVYVDRYLNNGSRDASYSPVAFESHNLFGASGMAVDGRGRVVVAQSDGAGISVRRFQTDGKPDLTFGELGVARIACPCSRNSLRVLIGADGKITIASPQGEPVESFGYRDVEGTLFVRLTERGRVDIRFGEFGRVLLPEMRSPGAVALRANGAIVAAADEPGTVLTKISADGYEVTRDWAVALRLKKARTYSAISPLPNGDLLIAGQLAGSRGFVARLRPSGALDRGFRQGGVARFPGRFIIDAAVDAHGRILLTGSGPKRVFAMRLRPRGRVDRRFRNGLASLTGAGVDTLAIAYAGPRPLVFDRGADLGCRGYCQPHPLLIRLKGGPGKNRAHRR